MRACAAPRRTSPPTRCGCSRRSQIDLDNAAYRDAARGVGEARSRRAIDDDTSIVLLGSMASPKYVDVLLDVFGERLLFPLGFVGRGDMSRGGLLLRAGAGGRRAGLRARAGAVRHGQRPPKLTKAGRGSVFHVPGSM